jgi:transcriptional regulator with XRE-family HTH domain
MLNLQVKDAVPSVSYAFWHMETIGSRIRQLREARGWTQAQFAKRVGVTKSAVSQWENDATKNLKLVTFLNVVDALGTTVEYLVQGSSRRPSRGPASDDNGFPSRRTGSSE